MSKIFASIALMAMLAVGHGVGAAEAVGWITHIDQEDDRVVLDDGQNFAVSDEINFSSLKNGVRVRIHFDAVEGEKIATEILLMPQAPQGASMPELTNTSPVCAQHQEDHLAKNLPAPTGAFC